MKPQLGAYLLQNPHFSQNNKEKMGSEACQRSRSGSLGVLGHDPTRLLSESTVVKL